MAVTISDVAKEAGVSTSTVSKVLNNWSSISPATCSRVHEAIKKLNYTPNARAVHFAKGHTNTILFLSTLSKEQAYTNPHMFDILCGAYKTLADNGYSLLLADIPETESMEEYLSRLISQKCADGIMIHGSSYSPKMDSILLSADFPHILIGHPGPSSRLCWIETNNGLAGSFAAKHMISCGYETPAFIGGTKSDYISMQRLNGFIGGMYEYGYRIPDEHIGYTDSTIQSGHDTALQMLTSSNPPCAIVCENNTIGLGVMNAIHELHLSLPNDIAFVTFDTFPYAVLINPTPTIIDIDMFDLGNQAALVLLNKIPNPSLLIQSYATLPVLKEGQTTRRLQVSQAGLLD